MTVSIPAAAIVNVVPNVVGAGGTGLDFSGLFLTNSTRIPVGLVLSFVSADGVSDFFGPSSAEYNAALRYFAGFDGSAVKPGAILFSQYATVAVPAFLQGGDVSGLTLAALQAIAGTITLGINGQNVTSAAINLSGANSFSAAAALIQTAIGHADAHVTGSISGTTLTVTAVADGALAIGQTISGTGVTAGTKIVQLGTGTGAAGTYIVDKTQTATATAITAGPLTVAFDPISGGFVLTGGTPGDDQSLTVATEAGAAPALKLTAATGAYASVGSDPMTPATAMATVTANTQNFVTFSTLFKPANADALAFAEWANTRGGRFPYVRWDDDVATTTINYAATVLGQIEAAGYDGTISVYAPVNGVYIAAFVMGAIASIDFNRVNGRTNLAFRKQSGLLPTVTNEQIAAQLEANGSNFYGQYATAADQFVFFYPGSISGKFDWIDTAINEIWMTNAFQLALMTLLTSITNIPYNTVGYGLIEQALADPITAAVSFGAIRSGVPLSDLQAAEVNTAAGVIISDTLTQRGWYLQVAAASAQVRAARGSPPINFWYTDGSSVQRISMTSIEVQ